MRGKRVKKIWLITFRRPVNPTAGFDRVLWCTSEFMVSRKIETNIVYCKIDPIDATTTRESISGITLYGIPCGSNILTKNMDFIKRTEALVRERAGRSDTFLLCGAMPLALAGGLKAISPDFKIVYYTFGSSVAEFQSILPELLRLLHFRKIRMMLLNIFTERMQLKNTDMVVVPHELARDEFRAQLHYRKKMAVVPFGQDIYKRMGSVKRYSSPELKKKKVLLFIGGRAWDRKGAIFIVRAFAQLKRRVPSVLIMTGVKDEKILAEAQGLGSESAGTYSRPGWWTTRHWPHFTRGATSSHIHPSMRASPNRS